MPQNSIGAFLTTVGKRIPSFKWMVTAGELKGCRVVNLSGMLHIDLISHFRVGNPAAAASTPGVKSNAIKF